MGKITWTTGRVDRQYFDEGPWDKEPDDVQWVDPATGYPCLIKRMDGTGHLCGYVAIPNTHPSHGLDYDHPSLGDITVHGGLTYEGLPMGGDFASWYGFGFDCAHAGDMWPYNMYLMPGMTGTRKYRSDESYKDMRYVKGQCDALAKQLYEVANKQHEIE